MCAAQPLHIAVKQEHDEIALHILGLEGVDVNTMDADGDSPLISALENGMLGVASKLISLGANVGIRSKTLCAGGLFHHYASRGAVNVLKLILNAGTFDPAVAKEAAGPLHFTPLHLAARSGRGEACQFLLPISDVNAVDKNGKTPAEVAEANRKAIAHKIITEYKP